jgi:hypothetical protein
MTAFYFLFIFNTVTSSHQHMFFLFSTLPCSLLFQCFYLLKYLSSNASMTLMCTWLQLMSYLLLTCFKWQNTHTYIRKVCNSNCIGLNEGKLHPKVFISVIKTFKSSVNKWSLNQKRKICIGSWLIHKEKFWSRLQTV